ncbi:OB-fold domain-containing protein [Rhizobium leguminosarum]|uniref:Zn-ribbon domain-containing OB-fold protein n=1 Tax=Rhizobium leguminosarum TaxID=384 RepID=UPI001031DD0B|nr:OB-fold domain-containing protein [Rhizobium leguminosarum]TBF87471.1 OB-fold domain-containing protein [Rhizobium leguminosarum]TBG07018.1 OB-fold domain-containing protein [Rhizobium leguminosarum]TBG07332.1 OB-fold domain-containing protein [Rhizobium leguminosarum]TBG30709.1 OB-fold domain-containing protein [Rhizobium leguminosarum]TBG49702.1 OB-fold domain-containing protein [Rhizobium leguminosarum]
MDAVKEAVAGEADTAKVAVNLSASRDKKGGKGLFPRVPTGSPSADRYEPIVLSSTASLYTFTIIHPNPKTGLQPYALIYADFAEDTRVFGRLELAPDERPSIGMQLRVVCREDAGDPDTHYCFEPLRGNDQ